MSKSRNDRKQVAFSLGGGTLRGKRAGLHGPVLLDPRPARRIRPSADGRQLERDIPSRSDTPSRSDLPRPPLRHPSLHPTLRSRDRRAHVRGLAEEAAPGSGNLRLCARGIFSPHNKARLKRPIKIAIIRHEVI